MRHGSHWRNCSFAASDRMKTALAPLSYTIQISKASLDQWVACVYWITDCRNTRATSLWKSRYEGIFASKYAQANPLKLQSSGQASVELTTTIKKCLRICNECIFGRMAERILMNILKPLRSPRRDPSEAKPVKLTSSRLHDGNRIWSGVSALLQSRPHSNLSSRSRTQTKHSSAWNLPLYGDTLWKRRNEGPNRHAQCQRLNAKSKIATLNKMALRRI